jgi:hypothetical protein
MSDKTKKSEKSNDAQEAPSTTLLSSISYTNPEDYEKFLENLSPEHAVIVLIAAANHCQARGLFTLDESELIAKSIRKLSAQPQTEQSSTPQEK